MGMNIALTWQYRLLVDLNVNYQVGEQTPQRVLCSDLGGRST